MEEPVVKCSCISGHVDPGESEFETALRETEEESGYRLADLSIVKEYKRELNYEVKGKPKRVVYWLAKLNNPEAAVTLSHEHIDYKWLNLQQAFEYAQYQDMQETLKDAHEYINNKTNL